MRSNYDIAAYIWPAYCRDERTLMFWPDGIGEWQSVKSATPKFEGHTQPRVPLWGYQDESDPAVMEMQIREAKRHGVNVFIYDWYWFDNRPFLEGCLNDGFLKAPNCEDMKFYLMWANHDAVPVWNKQLADKVDSVIWQGAMDRRQFDIIVHRLIDRYFKLPNYYTIDGCPVFCIYDLDNLVRGLGGVEETREALDYFRDEVVKAGLPGLHLQCILRRHLDFNITGVAGDNIGVQKDVVESLKFDSVTHYQFCHFMPIGQYDDMIKMAIDEWNAVEADYSIPYFPHVSIGWDNNPRFIPFRTDVTEGNTPEKFAEALRLARDFSDQHNDRPPLVTINSWNEWTETSYLLPDTLNGYGYLEAIRSVFVDECKKEDMATV